MEYITIYEDHNQDMMKDMEELGFEPYVGFIYSGYDKSVNEPFGFLVQANDEVRCVNIAAQIISRSISGANPGQKIESGPLARMEKKGENEEFGKMEDYLIALYEGGFIQDAGFYAGFKAKRSNEIIVDFRSIHMMNAGFVYNLGKEYFTNYKEIFERDLPMWKSREVIKSGNDKLRNWASDYKWK